MPTKTATKFASTISSSSSASSARSIDASVKNVIGKPMLYKTTKEFMIQFGLKDLTELPSLKEFEEIRRMAFSDSEPGSTGDLFAGEQAAPESAPEPVAEAAVPQAEPPAETHLDDHHVGWFAQIRRQPLFV